MGAFTYGGAQKHQVNINFINTCAVRKYGRRRAWNVEKQKVLFI